MKAQQTDQKIAAMREGGTVLGAILEELLEVAAPGIALLELEEIAQKRIKAAGMKPSFSTVADYRWATCLCVNDIIVHGIPTNYVLVEGDLLTIDIGLINRGYHTDTAWSKVIGNKGYKIPPEVTTFLDTGKQALQKAIEQARNGNRVGHISQTLQTIVEGAGYGIVRPLVGHGVGKTLHEEPQIPGFLKGAIEKTPKLTTGMTIAIEVIYSMGNPMVYYHEDGWSIATRDHSLSAVFEQTIAITDTEPLILTPPHAW
jgi:methionyl aminopeptidase